MKLDMKTLQAHQRLVVMLAAWLEALQCQSVGPV